MSDEPSSSSTTRPQSQYSSGKRLLFQIKDNAEMLIVAFIMALVIRCFFVEVFKIPTGSMEPTLMGNNERTGESGDRIMVNKFYYLFHSVDRFDVIVFRFPLNVMRNFIKRAVGVGPEYLRMERGDIYQSRTKDGTFHIARKDFEKQQSLWIPLPATKSGYTPSGADILDYWRFDQRENDSEDPHVLVLDGSGARSDRLIFNRPLRDMAVTADRPQESGRNQVKDLKISSTLSDFDKNETLEYRLTDASFEFKLVLNGSKPSRLTIKREDTRKDVELDLGSSLRSGSTAVSFFLYDGQVGVSLNGELLKQLTYRSTYAQLQKTAQNISDPPRLTCTNGSVQLQRLSLFRDLYYYWDKGVNGNFSKQEEPVKIPKGRFLVIGDNVNSSRDSRKWKMKVVSLPNDQTYYIDKRNWDTARKTNKEYVVDRSGRKLKLSRLQARGRIKDEEMRFIRKELLVGKAIWVWLPVDRIKFIR